MTFTYSTADLTTPLARVRLEIGDTDSTSALFQDEEITAKLDARGGDFLAAAADLCDILARRYARKPDFTTDNQAFKWSHVSKQWADLASSLRGRAGGITSAETQRVDGYSDDLTNRDVLQSDTSPRRRYWGDRDVPY